MVLPQHPTVLIMQPTRLKDQLGFVAKVLGLALLVAIALKTLGPRLAIPATSTVSLAIVLTPAIVMGGILGWQWWTSNDADTAHPERD